VSHFLSTVVGNVVLFLFIGFWGEVGLESIPSNNTFISHLSFCLICECGVFFKTQCLFLPFIHDITFFFPLREEKRLKKVNKRENRSTIENVEKNIFFRKITVIIFIFIIVLITIYNNRHKCEKEVRKENIILS
jgi:hypothetical protein